VVKNIAFYMSVNQKKLQQYYFVVNIIV